MSDLAQWLRGQAAHRTETDPYYLLFEAGALDAKDAELARLRAENEALRKELAGNDDKWRESLQKEYERAEHHKARALAAEARADKAAEDMKERAAEIARTFEDWGDYGGYLETASVQIAKRISSLPTESKDA